MSLRRTAAQIMQKAIMAETLVRLGTEDGYDAVWRTLSWERDWQGHLKGGSRERKLYESIEKGKKEISDSFLKNNPDFAEAYQAIFGDPMNVPSYPYFRKLVRMGRIGDLTDPRNWDKLPDSFEALYQMTFFPVYDLLESGVICKTTSLETVEELRRQYETDIRPQEKLEEQAAAKKRCVQERAEDYVRRLVTWELEMAHIIMNTTKQQKAHFVKVANMAEDEKARYIEERTAIQIQKLENETAEEREESLIRQLQARSPKRPRNLTKAERAERDAKFEASLEMFSDGFDEDLERSRQKRIEQWKANHPTTENQTS